jgi:hypothetical protein
MHHLHPIAQHSAHIAHLVGHYVWRWVTWEQPSCAGLGWHPCSYYYGHPVINKGGNS